MAKLKITLKRSRANVKSDQVATINALGLKKIGAYVEHEDTAEIRGMIQKVHHLIEVEEV